MNSSLTAIESITGVVRLHYQAGQVLYYQGHLPPGVFIALSGEIELVNAHGTTRRFRAASNAFLLPDPDRLDAPTAETALIHTPCEMVFIPRSLFSSHTGLRQLLETSGFDSPGRQSFPPSHSERP